MRKAIIGLILIGICMQAQATHPALLTVRFNGALIPDTMFVVKPSDSDKLFIKLTHSFTDTTQYQYRIEGIGSQWVDYRQSAGLMCYQLPGGIYRLLVRTKHRHQHIKTISIVIDPLLWQKWWFLPSTYFFVLLIFGSGLYFVYLYQLHQKVHLLTVRENIARDLHDDMGSDLGSISMLSQTILNIAEKDPQKARLLVNKIGETARQVMDSMSEIIWAINPEHDSIAQVIVRMKDVATDLLGENIALHTDIDHTMPNTYLPLEQRRDFFLIYKEALTNVAKYASANHVWVRLHRVGPAFILSVQDDGIGFDPAHPTGSNVLGGNGLKNMHIRAEKINGTLTIKSAPGQGTIVTLEIVL
jgi:two-component sensor histidine kinase